MANVDVNFVESFRQTQVKHSEADGGLRGVVGGGLSIYIYIYICTEYGFLYNFQEMVCVTHIFLVTCGRQICICLGDHSNNLGI